MQFRSTTKNEAVARLLCGRVTPDRLLRWSLGIVYLWFGALKFTNLSPVLELVRRTNPALATVPLYCGLAVFELGLGVLLFAGIWQRWTAVAAILHLTGTFGLLISSPRTVFQPSFPFLTMEGEFVVKNLVLLAAAASLWLMAPEQRMSSTAPRRTPLILGGLLASAVILLSLAAHLHRSLRVAAAHPIIANQVERVRLKAAEINTLTHETEPSITVEGTVVNRCGLLGCWLKLRDESGEAFVDLAPAGLSAKRIPVGSRIQVRGHIGRTREGNAGFVASSVTLLTEGEGR